MLSVMSGDVIRNRGFGALGCRIRRLSESIDRDLREIYQTHGVFFDPCWYPLIAAISDNGPLTLAEISQCTGLGSSTIGAIRTRMLQEGLISVEQDARDLRRQRLCLTSKGRDLCRDLDAVWEAIAKAAQGLCAETIPGLLSDLEVIETALVRRKLSARVGALMRR